MTNYTRINNCIADALGMTQDEAKALPADAKLTECGMDSIHFVQMIVLFEETLEIEILDSDLLIENFESKTKIAETLEKYF